MSEAPGEEAVSKGGGGGWGEEEAGTPAVTWFLPQKGGRPRERPAVPSADEAERRSGSSFSSSSDLAGSAGSSPSIGRGRVMPRRLLPAEAREGELRLSRSPSGSPRLPAGPVTLPAPGASDPSQNYFWSDVLHPPAVASAPPERSAASATTPATAFPKKLRSRRRLELDRDGLGETGGADSDGPLGRRAGGAESPSQTPMRYLSEPPTSGSLRRQLMIPPYLRSLITRRDVVVPSNLIFRVMHTTEGTPPAPVTPD